MFDENTKVLIVDDMLTMRKIVKKTCASIGLTNTVEAKDGQLAWDVINDAEQGIQLVISDWNMPNCSGLDLLKRVRGDSRFKELPFMLVTAESEQSQIVEAIQAGLMIID